MTTSASPTSSAITNLTSRMDSLESELEAFKSVRLRKPGTTSTHPPSSMVMVESGGTPSYHRK